MRTSLFKLNGAEEAKFEIVRWGNIGVGKTIGRLADNLRNGTGPTPAELLHSAAPPGGAALVATLLGAALAAGALLWL